VPAAGGCTDVKRASHSGHDEPWVIISAGCGGDLSNKIIQKRVAFRCEWGGIAPAAG
jgi:hypothetical protein